MSDALTQTEIDLLVDVAAGVVRRRILRRQRRVYSTPIVELARIVAA